MLHMGQNIEDPTVIIKLAQLRDHYFSAPKIASHFWWLAAHTSGAVHTSVQLSLCPVGLSLPLVTSLQIISFHTPLYRYQHHTSGALKSSEKLSKTYEDGYKYSRHSSRLKEDTQGFKTSY